MANATRNFGMTSMAGVARRSFFAAAALAALVAGGAACSSELTVSKTDLADKISEQLAQQVGHKPESVTCPADLKGTVGATQRCELTDEDVTYGVTTTVTAVNGTDVKFDIKVDDEPK